MQVVWVPGSFELPLVAKSMAKSGSYDAVLTIGAVVSSYPRPPQPPEWTAAAAAGKDQSMPSAGEGRNDALRGGGELGHIRHVECWPRERGPGCIWRTDNRDHGPGVHYALHGPVSKSPPLPSILADWPNPSVSGTGIG